MYRNTQPEPVAFETSGANCKRQLLLPEGIKLAEYCNGNERVFFQNDSCHTFSLYLKGGFETYRTDHQGPNGAPGRFSLMPQGSYSAWDVGSSQDFFHIYFSDDYVKRLALKTFDIDPRLVSLPQLTFNQDAAIEALCRHALVGWDWQAFDSALAMEQAVQLLLVNLIRQQGMIRSDPAQLTAGLAPMVRERVIDFIQANCNRQISLSELAEVAGLSEYHFCRMFKISLAQTPQQYITRLRVAKVKSLLEQRARQRDTTSSLADIALSCGFSNQSHMGRFFKQQTGLTPGRYLKRLM